MSASRALLLLLNTEYDGVVPQKTYDYLRCGSPILAYGTTSQGADFVARCGAGPVVAEGDVAGMIAALETLQTADRGVWSTPARAEFVASRNREEIAVSLLQALTKAG